MNPSKDRAADRQPWAPFALVSEEGETFDRSLYDPRTHQHVRDVISLVTSHLFRIHLAPA